MHAFSSTGAAAAVLAGLLDFTRVAVLVLPAAVVANAVWLRLPWIMWLGMVVYTCWALVLLAGSRYGGVERAYLIYFENVRV
ncbi:hypothetical protein MCOR17_006161 [Pyricularia oryzae]|nr:hypothetical protein MCOR17_006161 [Pyricularia oryzae]